MSPFPVIGVPALSVYYAPIRQREQKLATRVLDGDKVGDEQFD